MNSTSKPKYMEFLPKKKRAGILKVTQRPIVNLDTATVFDFIEVCIGDIIYQLNHKKNDKINQTILLSPEFLEKMYISVIDRALHYGKKTDPDKIESSNNDTTTSDEMFEKIKQEMLYYPDIKARLLSRISSVYLSKCMEYGLDPNSKILSKLFEK
jgi:hypothetical protein